MLQNSQTRKSRIKVVEVKCGYLWIFIMLGQYPLGQTQGCVTQCLLELYMHVLDDSATFLSLLIKLKHSYTLLKGPGSTRAPRGRTYCWEIWEKRR